MQELKAEKPTESPAENPVIRLMGRLKAEGFSTDQGEDDWENFGEIIYSRNEKISFASGANLDGSSWAQQRASLRRMR